ncbi:MAG: glycosyltransferase family 2 protein [Campylobacterota bacterium]|nr:glycosyltransferase family 2 protein [Campylobacterota bacterium]
MHPPLLSIVMTTYNGEKYLKEQLDSILNQTFQDFTLIISDDNSTDNTINIIQEYQQKYSCITLHKNTTSLGSVLNFEKALQLSQTRYTALSDQDDIWELNKLQLQLNAMTKLEKEYPELPLMVHSDLSMIDKDSKESYSSYFKFRSYSLGEERDLGHILGPCGVMGNTILINKKLQLSVLPFPSRLKVHDYWIALVAETQGKRHTIQETLVKYRIHKNNLSNSEQTLTTTLLSKIKKLFFSRCTPPYINQDRESTLEELLECFSLREFDKNIIKAFLYYLKNPTKNRLKSYMILIKHKIIKKHLFYKIKTAVAIFLCN